MFTIVFKYLLFFNFNNKRVRRTFSGGYIVFVGMPHASCAITIHSSDTGPHLWANHTMIAFAEMSISSSANSENFAKGKRYQPVNISLYTEFYTGFNSGAWCVSQKLSFLTCQLRVRVHVFLDQFHPWLTICVCLCKGVIQQQWCKLTNYEDGSFFIVPWRWRERMKALHKEWESHFRTLLLSAGLRC